VIRTVYPAKLALAGTTTAGGATGDGDVTNAGTFVVSGNFGTGGTYTQSGGLTNVLAGAILDKDVVLNGGTLKGTPAPARPANANVTFATRCRQHRLTVRISGDVRRATISVNGRRAKTLSKPGTATLRGRRRTEVAVAVTLTDGRTLGRRKTYRTC
jgi:hypothetical protein